MDSKCTFLALLFTAVGIAQIVPPSDSTSNAMPRFMTLKTLSKIQTDSLSDGLVMPLGYKWTRDVRSMEAIKRSLLHNKRIDANGRELPPDVFHEVRTEVMFKSRISKE